MRTRVRIAVLLAAGAAALAAPAAASAHAYLVKTVPAASVVLSTPPHDVQLTYDEAVEPRFAIISVTSARGTQETTGPVTRSSADPDTLLVPVRPQLPEGWYLIYWRAISVDGHPVQGAFTYAVGPNPGPAPQFQVPSIAAGATAPQVLVTRWLMFVSTMAAVGLLAMRLLIARPLGRGGDPAGLQVLNRAFTAAAVLGLIAVPVYLDVSIANDSLRPVLDLGALVPLYGVTAFGRGLLDLELCFALFCLAGWIGLWVERPERRQRSLAELAATTGALLAGAAVMVVPGAVGHAAQTSPRGLTLFFDWVHMSAAAVWMGGLVGLLALAATRGGKRLERLRSVVPRFSATALGAVLLLAGAGVGEAVDHLPAVNALWGTGYGQAILVKSGLLAAVLVLAAGNLLRSRPRLAAADQRPEQATPAARLLTRLAGGEVTLIAGILFAAALLSSLAPPPPAFALESSALASVGPGRVAATVHRAGYALQVLVSPNRAAAPDRFALRITRNGSPVRHANVTLTFNHTEMQMPQEEYQLAETGPGVYTRAAPALVMVGRWALTFQITPPGSPPLTALIVDQANG